MGRVSSAMAGETPVAARSHWFRQTSSPIPEPKGPLETRSSVDALICELQDLDDGAVWILGGGKLQMAFIERHAMNEIEIWVMPELVGGGKPLFPATGARTTPRLLSAKALDRGCIRLHYRFDLSH